MSVISRSSYRDYSLLLQESIVIGMEVSDRDEEAEGSVFLRTYQALDRNDSGIIT